MSQFEQSEVWTKYAEMMGFTKKAWTWRDIVEDLGMGVAIDVGLGAGWGALTGAGAVAGGAAALAWPVVLLGGAIGLAMFAFTKQMDDNLDDLIDRLSALDPNPSVAGKVDGWISTLNRYKSVMQMAPTTTDVAQRAQVAMQQYAGLKELSDYMLQMEREWPFVKQNLDDMGWDPSQAEHAIQLTGQKVNQVLAAVRVQAQQAEAGLAKEVETTKKTQEKGQTGTGEKAQKKQRVKKPLDPVVKGLQRLANNINYALNGGLGIIDEDGVYDKYTADALIGAISSSWQLQKAVAQNARLNLNSLKDIKLMTSNPNLLRRLYSTLAPLASSREAVPGVGGEGARRRMISERETIEYGPARNL